MEVSNTAAGIQLRNSPLLGQLSRAVQERLIDMGHTHSARRDEILYLQGDPGDRLYLIVAGTIRISASSADGRELHLNTLGPGEVMGEIALLDGESRTATATMTSDGVLFCIERKDFLSYLAEEPTIALQLIALLCSRTRWLSSLLEDAAFLSTEARIAKRILLLAQSAGVETTDGLEVRLSQQDLARYLNLTRQVVNQTLQALQSDGIITIGRGRLTVRDVEALLACSSGDRAGNSPPD